MTQEDVQPADNVTLILRDEFGNIKHHSIHNQVQTLGKELMADQMITGASTTAGPTHAKVSHCAVGTGTGAAVGATVLNGTELARVALGTKTRSTNVVTFPATGANNFPAGTGTGTITEAALFNASSAGTRAFYASFGAITKGASDTLDITWTLTFP